MSFKPDMTVASILDINPKAAQVLFRYGIRSFFSPSVANETIEQLSQQYQFSLAQVMEELEGLLAMGTDFLVNHRG